MSRVAFVTGGTRGIGRAITARLKAAGYKVAAGYAGNEVAAQACASELGVMVIKGNVSLFADCAAARVCPIPACNTSVYRGGVYRQLMPCDHSTEVVAIDKMA